MATAGPLAPGASASAAEKRVPSAEVSSSVSAPAPPAIGGRARSGGRAGGRAAKGEDKTAPRRTLAGEGRPPGGPPRPPRAPPARAGPPPPHPPRGGRARG